MTTVVNIKGTRKSFDEKNVTYIGRSCYMGGWSLKASKWQNPFTTKQGIPLEEVLVRYEKYIREGPLFKDIEELRGKTLGCWCKPAGCHGDILIKILQETVSPK